MAFYRVHYRDPKLGKQVYVADAMKTAPSGVVELHSGSGMSHSQTVVVIGAGAFHVIERFEKEEHRQRDRSSSEVGPIAEHFHRMVDGE